MELAPRLSVLIWALIVAAGLVVGAHVLQPLHVGLDASPFVGHWRAALRLPLLVPIGLALVFVVAGPVLAARLPWWSVPLASGLVAIAWAVTLAATDGWAHVTAPLVSRYEYLPFAARVHDPGRFLRTFVVRAPAYPVHVKGHPPGATLVPWALHRVGLTGAGWFAALVLVGWGVGVAAVLVATRTVAGEDLARRAAPALVVLPAAVWAATSADALFTGVVALGIAVAVLGSRRAALLGGAVIGLGLLLTYGAAVLLLIPLAVHGARRRWGHAALVVGGVLTVLVATGVATGFWWLDGLRQTRTAYWQGVASRRPGVYLTLLGNPTALLVAIGPAAVAGLVALVVRRGWRPALLSLAALAAVALADISQLSRGEVERIWLPFAVWLAAAAIGDRRWWLAAQAATGIAVQAVLVSLW